MVQTREQIRKQEQLDQLLVNQEFQRLVMIEIEQEFNPLNYQNIVYRPILFIMTEKLINIIFSNNLDKLPKFAGKHSENISKWLTEITNELNLVNLNDQQRFSLIQTFLRDDARRRFINNMSLLTDWSTFVIRIRKTFSSSLHQELAIKRLGTRQQSMDEAVLHYYNDVMKLFDMIDLNMRDQYKVGYLKAGLKVSLKKEVIR